MNALIAALERIETKIINKCEQRDKTALQRSDKWQNSPKGKLYETKTKILADSVFDIRDSITKIKASQNES